MRFLITLTFFINIKLIIISVQVEKHLKMYRADCVARCYGITKDPETNNFVMVMEYAKMAV